MRGMQKLQKKQRLQKMQSFKKIAYSGNTQFMQRCRKCEK